MNLIRIFIIHLLAFISLELIGQVDSSKTKKIFVLPNGIGYAWKGSHNLDADILIARPLAYRKNHSNVGISIAANFMFYKNSTYLSPTTKVRIMKHKRPNFFGWSAAIGHSYSSVNNKYDHRLTPEIGLRFGGGFELNLGYNIPLNKYRDGFTTYYKLGFRISSG